MTVKTSLVVSSKPVIYKLPPKLLRDEDRKFTDGNYFIVFCVILAVWLTSCGYVLYFSADLKIGPYQTSQQTKKLDERLLEEFQRIERLNKDVICDNFERMPWFVDMLTFYLGNIYDFNLHYKEMGSTFIWASVLFFSVLLISAMGVLAVSAACSPAALLLISSTLLIVSITYHGTKYFVDGVQQLETLYTKFAYWIGPEAVLFLFSLIVLLISTKSRGVSKTCDMVKKAFKYYFTCRYVILIGFIICFMIVLLNAFTAQVFDNFNVNDVESRITYWIIYSGSVYMMILIHIFGRMIISATAASYYWDQNRQQSPFKVMCKKIFAVSKFHFGSACYKATYTSIWFTLLLGVLMGYEFKFYKLAKYCLIFDLLHMLTIDYTIFFIAMFGLRASEATRELFRVFGHSKEWIIFACQNFWSASFLILMPTNCLMLILMWGLDQHDRAFSWVSTRSYAEILCIFLPIIYVLSTIEDARALCIMGEKADKREAIKAEMKAIETAEKLEKSLGCIEEPTQVLVISDSSTDTSTPTKPEQ